MMTKVYEDTVRLCFAPLNVIESDWCDTLVQSKETRKDFLAP